LQADPATADILVIALSANAMPLDIDRAQRAGFFRYLTKPIKLEEFMEALEDAFAFSDHKPCRQDVATLLP
jgi:CheY-like chemotaxis protein